MNFRQILSGAACGLLPLAVMARSGAASFPNDSTVAAEESLETVVVSANRNETKRRLAPTLVSVLGQRTFEQTQAATLAQGLSFQPGLRVENNCQNCGFQQVRINGLDGPYTQILVDSRPIFSALAGVYGLEQIPANMIERVEVMRGGGSALFGSSAIAGTINIITREPRGNAASVAHTLRSVGLSGAWENHTTLNASLVAPGGGAGLCLFAQRRGRDAYDADGDGFTELSRQEGQSVGLRSFFRLPGASRLSVEYHYLTEFRRGGNLTDRPPHEADVAEQTDHRIHTAGAAYDFRAPGGLDRLNLYASMQHIHRDSYYGGHHDLDAYGTTADLTWIAGAQYSHEFGRCLFLPATLTAGAEYASDALDDNMWGYGRTMSQTAGTASLFLQNDWKNERWGFLLGGRLDKHSLMDHVIFSPRVNLRFNPVPRVNLRASYSQGFRAPQAFDEDLHIANVGGTVSMIRLADGLREEKSQSLSLSADTYFGLGCWQANLLAEVFYTWLDDVFALREVGVVDGVLMNERYNESGAAVGGVTLEGRLEHASRLRLQAGFTLQHAAYREARSWSDDPEVPAERRLMRSPRAYGYFTCEYRPARRLTLTLSGLYTGRMKVEHRAGYIDRDRTETTPRFMELGLRAAYGFTLRSRVGLELYGGLQNLFDAYQPAFDRGPDRDSGYIFGPVSPRSAFAGLKFSL